MNEQYRPHYHFMPPSNWINDPNGLIEWKGQYHLFYQYKADQPDFGNAHMLWGHATSTDLVHWQHLPVVLYPDTPYDKNGCWSGCAVDDHSVPTLVYTGRVGDFEYVCSATSHDDLLTFQKDEGFVLDVPRPQGEVLVGFRDPYVFRGAEGWDLVMGTGFEGKHGRALLYTSPNLHDWTYRGPLLEGTTSRTGDMWECPNFFPLGDRHVLMVSASPNGYEQYFVGRFDNRCLAVEQQGSFDDGQGLYAPQTFQDSQRRRILFGWIWEELTKEGRLANGWAGFQSLPRELYLSPEGRLYNRPVAEVAGLRREAWQAQALKVPAHQAISLPVSGSSVEILAKFKVGQSVGGIRVACSPDGREATSIGFRPYAGKVFIDRQQTRLPLAGETYLNDAGREPWRETDYPLLPGDELELDIFFDRSVLEVFINGQISLTTRIYPSLAESTGIQVFAGDAEVVASSVQVWQMADIWKK